ncbi:MAG: LVIVD repeat-containing protein [Verrucomicrobiia bacterium]
MRKILTLQHVGIWPSYWRGPASAVAVAGNFAYVAAGALQVIDVHNPVQPERIGQYHTPFGSGWITDVAAEAWPEGDAGRGRLSITDVSDPASPRITGAIDVAGWPGPLAVSGNVACVMVNQAGLQVIDISNASAPVLVGTYANDGLAWAPAVALSDSQVWVAGDGLWSIDRHKLFRQTSAIGSLRSRSVCGPHGFSDLRSLCIGDRQRCGVARH